jgi:transposase
MVILGADLHKRWHTVVAVDETGRKLADKTVRATPDGHLELRRWAARFPERRWALEDCRHLSRRLEVDLLRSGEAVVRVPPKLMAGVRRSVREPGKSDPIDALAVAGAALREPDLPVATLDGPERELRLLVDHREDLVAERTRHIARLRWHLLDLGVDEPGPRSLDRAAVLADLEARLAGRPEPAARLARDLLGRIQALTLVIRPLGREIGDLAASLAPTLLALPGCGRLTAAKIVGETAGMTRFRSKEAFARHNGSAPVPVWSGNVTRHRLSRGGNRQLNLALHRIAITQMRIDQRGRAYLERRRAAGDTKSEAIRALRRRISDEVFRRLRADETARVMPLTVAA